jgi:hypothetical protein
MKVAIVGSRDWFWDFKGETPSLENDYWCGEPADDPTYSNYVFDALYGMTPEDYVVTGGATGVDWWAEEFARVLRIGRIVHMPNWKKYGKPAGPIRNSLIVADAEALFAIYTDKSKSRGTIDSVTKAKKKGIPVYEFDAATQRYPSWAFDIHDEMAGLSRKSGDLSR